MSDRFDYDRAFERNLGLVSEDEQTRLRNLRVALPGLGGVGGAHLQALARMGVGAFHLADPDTFEVANFNRQLGASMDSVGHGKAATSARILRDINPDADVKIFDTGIDADNLDTFLDGVDIVVDGIEFFNIDIRRALYRACHSKRIPVVNAGPIGFGAAILVFAPDTPSLDEHFGITDEMTRVEQLLAFGLGLGPGLSGDIDPRRVSFERQKGPALSSACCLCAALAATEVLKLATGRGQPAYAPHGLYFDPLRGQVTPLRPAPSLRSEEGQTILAHCFHRFPELETLYDRERSELVMKGA